jgi:glycogen debranching enzyme
VEAIESLDARTAYGKSVAGQRLPTFTIPASALGLGASLGNSAVWINTKGTGAIERIFLNAIGQSLIGTFSLRYGANVRPLRAELAAHALEGSSALYSPVLPDTHRPLFEIHPAYQRVRFQFGTVIDVTETTFVPLDGVEPSQKEPPIVYVIVDLYNRDEVAVDLRVIGSAMLRGTMPADIRTRYDPEARALVGFNASHPEWVRVLGLSQQPTHYATGFDYGATYDPSHLDALTDDTSAEGDVIGRLQLDFTLPPLESRQIVFTIGLYAAGEADALRQYARAENSSQALERSIEHLETVLRYGRVLTPDAVINHGALWSKVSMRRVMASYPMGYAFTNDPGKSVNVVIRDSAWFVFGNDLFLPSFSRRLLDNLTQRQYPDGKLPEYVDAVSGRIEDDGLNINDDTPLYILAVNHHFRASGDVAWLAKAYPSVARAARYIMSQIDDRGLVFCSANDPRGDVWAIAGWRNIIAGYSINGAVTELNAECVAALRAASNLADDLGDHEQDAQDFREATRRVRKAMDTHLINPDNGLYYLNLDVDGNPHTDVTGDEIFPVIMRACSDETAFLIISRLNSPDFWTSAGLRTVSRLDPRFDPTAHSGLLGGVWPGLTWWYAFGAARYHPEFMVTALRASFEHYGVDPRRNNTVPGQFSEWFCGESLVNQGMRLSPWEPPRFLWAAIEGVCGLTLSPGPPRINPLIPAHWTWVGVRDLPHHGSLLSYFLVRERATGFRIYSTETVDSNCDVTLYQRDVSDNVRAYADEVVIIGLARDDAMAILVGNSAGTTLNAPISIKWSGRPTTRVNMRIYNSERGDWETLEPLAVTDLRAMVFPIEAGGFRLIELSAE